MAGVERQTVGEVAVIFQAGAPVPAEQERMVSSTVLPETNTVPVVFAKIIEQAGAREIGSVVRVKSYKYELCILRSRSLIRLLTKEFAQFFARVNVVGHV